MKNKKNPTRCHLLFYCTSYGLTYFGHYYAHHQDFATIMLITTLVVSFLVSLRPGHYSSLIPPNLQHTAKKERNDQCGNQHYNCELLLMGIVMPEICCAFKRYNEIISGIWLVFYSSVIAKYLSDGKTFECS